jgi:UDP-N-acetylmuramoylalanine--D-glutamate ligase
MIRATSFKGKTVAVFGLARSGLSAARSLTEAGAEVLAWDDTQSTQAQAGRQGLALAPWERWPWGSVAAIILSPGVPLTHPAPHPIVQRARQEGVEIIGDIELFARAIRLADGANAAPVIAVTGTNGKSTTTALIGHILQACGFHPEVGGNFGRPALDLGAPGPKTVYVLEVSSYQIDISPGLAPDVAILTNLSPDHIDRHGSMAQYAAVKERLLRQTLPNGLIAIGVDDADSAAIHTRLAAERGPNAIAVAVGKVLGRGVFVIDGKLYDSCDRPATLLGDLNEASHLPGAHNWQNAALASTALRRLIRDPRAVMGACLRFPGLAHRIEDVGRLGKVRFINDSKATNADASARALACYPDIFWIAGGKPKAGGIASLAPFFPRIRRAYLIGEAAGSFGQTLEGKTPLLQAGTLDHALMAAFADAAGSDAPDPVVLLSPACASFDQFRDFEHRGDVFREAVKKLIETHAGPSAKDSHA